MITDKSRYGHDAVLDLDCSDSVQVLRTEPMTLTAQEQEIVRAYLGIMLLEKSYIGANGHLILALSDGREVDLGSARGLPGATPYIGGNGNWFVEGRDTLVHAQGPKGDRGDGVPALEAANNARFLRNDGTWQTVTPANIGAADASHTQSAATITGGKFAGAVYANRDADGQEPSYCLIRNSKIVSSETNPTVNGEISWTYK